MVKTPALHIDSYVVGHHCNNIPTIAHVIKKFKKKKKLKKHRF